MFPIIRATDVINPAKPLLTRGSHRLEKIVSAFSKQNFWRSPLFAADITVRLLLTLQHQTVQHGIKEWARDDDGDGIREVHVNTIEGLWTTLRNFLRLFRRVHKKYLGGYVAMLEFTINLERISPAFISSLVTMHSVRT